VEDRVGADQSGVDAHGQRVDDQAGAHVCRELPTDHHPGGQVDHGGQVEPALPGLEVGDVADQPLARRRAGRVEVPPDQIRRLHRVLAADRGAPIGARLHRPQTELAHQVRDQPDAALVPLTVERSGHPPTARGLPRVVEDPPHLFGQLSTTRCGRGLGPVAPGVEARTRHAQQRTHPDDLVGGLLRLDQRAALGY
jgi:hypothetical protein